ncbi:hypothetical protein [Haloarcula rubra]|uniref:hypothetical protein n=1 Tax=Haloarcula rubra TaxID=2487747 RepID=UPI001F3DAAB6|nr:hypothetical protein [Halomicroarcula rubra]
MDHPLSANSTLRLKEIGALFGAILADQGADVGGFGDDFQTVPMHVDTPVLQRQAAVLAIDEDVGNSTNGWKAIPTKTAPIPSTMPRARLAPSVQQHASLLLSPRQ